MLHSILSLFLDPGNSESLPSIFVVILDYPMRISDLVRTNCVRIIRILDFCSDITYDSGTHPKPVMGVWMPCPALGKIELN